MCKNKKHITFCTCNQKESGNVFEDYMESLKAADSTEEYNKVLYYWTLKRTIRKYTTKERWMIMGELVMPSKKLDGVLTAEFVVDKLNKGVEFDFDYNPVDGDELIIGITYKYAGVKNKDRPRLALPMKFVYENEEWYFGYISHFEYLKEKLNEGKITLHNI